MPVQETVQSADWWDLTEFPARAMSAMMARTVTFTGLRALRRQMATVSIGSEEAYNAHMAATGKPSQLLYFTAQWCVQQRLESAHRLIIQCYRCGPCQMVAPEIDKLSEEYETAADVLKIDLDTNPECVLPNAGCE